MRHVYTGQLSDSRSINTKESGTQNKTGVVQSKEGMEKNGVDTGVMTLKGKNDIILTNPSIELTKDEARDRYSDELSV